MESIEDHRRALADRIQQVGLDIGENLRPTMYVKSQSSTDEGNGLARRIKRLLTGFTRSRLDHKGKV